MAVAARQVCVIVTVLRRAPCLCCFKRPHCSAQPLLHGLSTYRDSKIQPGARDSTGLAGALNRLVLNKYTGRTRAVPAADVHWAAEPGALLYPAVSVQFHWQLWDSKTSRGHCLWQVLCGAARASVLQKTSLFQNSDQGYRYSISGQFGWAHLSESDQRRGEPDRNQSDSCASNWTRSA